MKYALFAIGVMFVVLAGYNLTATPFEPLFQIVSFEGECHVQLPDAKNFQPAEAGKTYAYGTAVKTGRKSTALIRFSEGNECRVMANANIVITEDVRDPKLKIIKLKEGEVDVSLDEKFGESNGLNVETPTAICGAIGCKFNVRSSSANNDLTAVVIMCKEGKIKAFGKDFNIPLLEAEDGVSIVGNGDLSFIKIRNVLGNFNIHVRDANGNEKIFEFKKDWEIKIWRKISADNKTIIITILISGPDGALIEAITRTAPMEGEGTGQGTEQEGQGSSTQEGTTTATTQSAGEEGELITETPTTTIPATGTTISPAEQERTDQILDQLEGNPPPPPPPPPPPSGGTAGDEGEDHHNPTPSGNP